VVPRAVGFSHPGAMVYYPGTRFNVGTERFVAGVLLRIGGKTEMGGDLCGQWTSCQWLHSTQNQNIIKSVLLIINNLSNYYVLIIQLTSLEYRDSLVLLVICTNS